MSKNTHAPQPRLCRECESSLLSLADVKSGPDFHYCPHLGTLAILEYGGGVISAWHLSGPISLDAAQSQLNTMRRRALELFGEPDLQ